MRIPMPLPMATGKRVERGAEERIARGRPMSESDILMVMVN